MTIEQILNYLINEIKKELDNNSIEVLNYLKGLSNNLTTHEHKYKNIEGYKLADSDFKTLEYNILYTSFIFKVLQDPRFKLSTKEETQKQILNHLEIIKNQWNNIKTEYTKD